MTSPLQQQLTDMATQALAAHGLVLVQARLAGSGRFLTLQVLAENPDGSTPGLDDCARASRTLSAQLDVADLIKGRYVLEVSSPGLERPLVTPADYRRFIGRHARFSVAIQQMVNGSAVGASSGVLLSADETSVTIHPNDSKEQLTVRLADIRGAHLDPSADELALFMKKHPLPGEVFPVTALDDAPPVMNA